MSREVYVVSTSIIDELGAQLVNFGPRRKTFVIPTNVVSYAVENAGSSPIVKSFYDFLAKLFGWFEQPASPGGVEAHKQPRLAHLATLPDCTIVTLITHPF